MKYYLFFVFLLAGSLSACCNFLSRIFFQEVFSYGLSVVLSYFVGMAIAYTMYKVIFSFEEAYVSSIKKFVLVNLIGMTQTYFMAMAFFEVFSMFMSVKHAEDISHFAALGLLSITSYTLHKNYTFRKRAKRKA